MRLEETDFIQQILEKHGYQSSSLVGILQDIQSRMNYLPRSLLKQISKYLDIPLSDIYGVATFYKAFHLEPKGRHTLQVCLGTACHVRGSRRILNYLETLLDVKAGETTKDLSFSLETVNCLGACALGPLLVIDRKYYGKISAEKLEGILKRYQ